MFLLIHAHIVQGSNTKKSGKVYFDSILILMSTGVHFLTILLCNIFIDSIKFKFKNSQSAVA